MKYEAGEILTLENNVDILLLEKKVEVTTRDGDPEAIFWGIRVEYDEELGREDTVGDPFNLLMTERDGDIYIQTTFD